MTVLDHKKLTDHIRNWLIDYADKYGKNAFIYKLDLSENKSVEYLLLEDEILKKINNFNRLAINTTRPEIKLDFPLKIKSFEHYKLGEEYTLLTAIADHHNELVINLANRNEVKLARLYKKSEASCSDIFPFADLFHSEITELAKKNNEDNNKANTNSSFTWRELEWADNENEKTNLITSDNLPTQSKEWFKYTIRQKEIITTLHQREKLTRHKKIIQPMFEINMPGLVRR